MTRSVTARGATFTVPTFEKSMKRMVPGDDWEN